MITSLTGGTQSLTTLTTSELVRAAAAGDERAWDALVDRFARNVWAVARAHRLGDSDAADVVQNTWLRLVEHLDDLAEPERLGAWLATTARRESLRVLRAQRRHVPTQTEDMLVDEADPYDVDSSLGDLERERALWTAFSHLPPRCQALLRMLATDPQPSYEEISHALGMPIGSIGPTRARALERLRREVERSAGSAWDPRRLRLPSVSRRRWNGPTAPSEEHWPGRHRAGAKVGGVLELSPLAAGASAPDP